MSRTVVIRVGSVTEARRELKADLATMTGGEQGRRPREIWFASLEQLAGVLTEKRLTLLRLIHRKRPRSVAQLTRLAGRGTRAIEGDLRVLEGAGLVRLAAPGGVVRPVACYDRIHLAGDIRIARAAA